MDLFLILILIAAVIPVSYAAIIGAPPVPAKKQEALVMLREAGIKNGDVVFDLGAQTGRLIIMARKEFSKNICGIEFAPVLWLMGIFNLAAHKISPSLLKFGNFYNLDFGAVDVFFCFLTPKAMAKLKPKFEAEAKKGSRIISLAFEISGWTPKKIVRKNNLAPVFVYEV